MKYKTANIAKVHTARTQFPVHAIAEIYHKALKSNELHMQSFLNNHQKRTQNGLKTDPQRTQNGLTTDPKQTQNTAHPIAIPKKIC